MLASFLRARQNSGTDLSKFQMEPFLSLLSVFLCVLISQLAQRGLSAFAALFVRIRSPNIFFPFFWYNLTLKFVPHHYIFIISKAKVAMINLHSPDLQNVFFALEPTASVEKRLRYYVHDLIFCILHCSPSLKMKGA
jgi:hypothetical protein